MPVYLFSYTARSYNVDYHVIILYYSIIGTVDL